MIINCTDSSIPTVNILCTLYTSANNISKVSKNVGMGRRGGGGGGGGGMMYCLRHRTSWVCVEDV